MAADDRRTRVRNWIEDIERRFKVSRPEIAARARVHPATLYRWFDDSFSFEPSARTLGNIAEAFGVPMPGGEPLRPSGFQDSDLVAEYSADMATSLAAHSNNQFIRAVQTRALELAGYLPGDLVLVDQSVQATSGDVVCAQVYNLSRGTAETKLRLYEAPFLLTRTMDPAAHDKPLYVDGERVVIAGVVIRSMRSRVA